MQFDPNKFTVKAQEALQSAATFAGSRQHQQIEPVHLLHVMLSDSENIGYQIARKIEVQIDNLLAVLDRELDRIPKVTGASATGQYISQDLGKVFDFALKEAESLKDEYISSEHLFIAMSEAGGKVSTVMRDAGLTRDAILKVVAGIRGSQRVTSQTAEDTYNSLKKYSRNLRQTFDIDVKISVTSENDKVHFIEQLRKIAVVLPEDPMQFIAETSVLPVTLHEVRVDLVFAQLPFEELAIERSRRKQFFSITMNVCSVEDFILQKAVSTRQKDWDDIETVTSIQKENIDWQYLLEHCAELSGFLSDSTILTRIQNMR